MNETMVCVVGNVATRPVYRETVSGPSARFRIAVTARYWDRERNSWADGHTNFFTVWANRQLATNAAASLSVGEPVIVQGRLKVRTETRDGQPEWMSADIDAVSVGHDLARGTTAFRRTPRPETSPAPDRAESAPDRAETALVRAEPAWETDRAPSPPADGAGNGATGAPGGDASQLLPEAAMVT
ncbi:single-stranded DNA-binding protein [Streptomyces lusitanus]|uniref:Single-stranded DNA-binding protein n=1 Tax=Streptomyces lusitanus TaxID=68232 RepID=A0ABU3JVL2_9ACTN|nr:single-stranded DNA-binding protein [Streptomyces lusitanus]